MYCLPNRFQIYRVTPVLIKVQNQLYMQKWTAIEVIKEFSVVATLSAEIEVLDSTRVVNLDKRDVWPFNQYRNIVNDIAPFKKEKRENSNYNYTLEIELAKEYFAEAARERNEGWRIVNEIDWVLWTEEKAN